MPTLNKGSHAEALYAQLIAQLRESIFNGTLPPGSRVPTELELAKNYQISRGTVRQAITALVNDGLLERTRGRGTFVRSMPAPQNNNVTFSGKQIGVILSNPGSEMDLQVLIGIEHAARARGYQVIFTFTEENMEQQTHEITRLQAGRVAGMIIFPIRDLEYDESIWHLKQDGVPFVLADRYFPGLDTDYVASNNFGGGYRATEHLIILGHTRIGFVHAHTGTLNTTSVRDRWEGYRAALQEYGLPFDETLVFGEAPPNTGDSRETFGDLFTRADRPTALVTSTDHLAVTLMQAIQRRGLRIPEDVAIVAYDNCQLSAGLHPTLTTIAQSFVDMGQQAGNLLINRIEGQIGPAKHIEIATNLIVRESCGARLHVRALSKSK